MFWYPRPLRTTEFESLKIKSSKKGAFSLVGRSPLRMLLHSCALYTWDFNLRASTLTGLTTLRWRLNKYHVKRLWQALSRTPKLRHVKSSSSQFVGPKPMGFQALFCLSWMVPCLVSIPPWHLTLSTATSHLLKLLRTWGLVKLPIAWALDEHANSRYQTHQNCTFKLSTWALV